MGVVVIVVQNFPPFSFFFLVFSILLFHDSYAMCGFQLFQISAKFGSSQ